MTTPPQPEEQERQLHERCYNQLRTEVKLKQWWIKENARHEARKAQLQTQKDNTINELNKYAQVTCRNLCAKIFEVCPREIRDYIYAYLLPNSPVVLHECDHRNCDSRSCAQESDLLEKFAQPPSHLSNAAYITPDFFTELLERFYSTTTFDLHDQFAKVGAFRTMDAGNYGIIPANYILKVSLFINCGNYDFDGVTAPLASPYRPFPLKPRRALLADLEGLFGFRSGTTVALHLWVNRSRQPVVKAAEYWECDTVIPVILPTVRRLAAAGTKVTLCFDCFGWELTVHHGDVTTEEIKSGLSSRIGR